MKQTVMKDRAILPLVLSMSLPMVLSMLFNSLYNIIDSYFVSRIQEEALTALSLVYPLQILISAVSVGFGVGVNSVAAYYLGAQESEKANDAVSLGLLLSVVHGLLLTIGCSAVIPWFLKAFTNDPVVIRYGLEYSYIVFGFSVIVSAGIALEKIFQAEGQMQISMLSMLSGCVVNILLDPLMIFGIGPFPAWGIAGAAWATGLSQIVPLCVYLVLYFRKELPLRLRMKQSMLDPNLAARLYTVGIPAAMNMALPSVMITVLNGILAAFSERYVLVLGIYYKLQTFIYMIANGIVQGIRPIVGYNYGAREYKRVRQTFRTALGLSAVIMAFGTMVCSTCSASLMHIFTETPEIIAAGETALKIISMGFIVSSASIMVSGTLEGLGQGLPSLVISLMRYTVVMLPLAFLLSKAIGVNGVWYAFCWSELLTGLGAMALYKKVVLGRLLRER